MTQLKIGLALGGGAARGWAHIGVIKTLAKHGVVPDIVCGTSIGALVGAAYVTGKLDDLEEWVLSLRRRDIAGLLDFSFGGGMIQGERLMTFFLEQLSYDPQITELSIPFGAVATELATGNEMWLQSGSLLHAVRASIALPGLFTPVCQENQWLVDGALVNPVPISLCRAMGADFVIAVNLNSRMVGRSFRKQDITDDEIPETDTGIQNIKNWFGQVMDRFADNKANNEDTPGLFDVLSNSVYIMQDRITRSRMAGDPPDLLLSPDLSDIGMMDFDNAREAIDKGITCVERHRPSLDGLY